MEYVFGLKRRELLCKETLFVADEFPEQTITDTTHETTTGPPLRESHYRYTHPKNFGKLCKCPSELMG